MDKQQSETDERPRADKSNFNPHRTMLLFATLLLAVACVGLFVLAAVFSVYLSFDTEIPNEHRENAPAVELVGYHSPVLPLGRDEHCLTVPPGRLVFVDPMNPEPTTVDRLITVEYQRTEGMPVRLGRTVECPAGRYHIRLSKWQRIVAEARLQRDLAGRADEPN
ncbi:MAG: hypothetical protein ABIJ46_01350 [bacterium]